jgi:hypothetical protein
MSIDPAIATAADYADALIVARRAKKFVILALILLLIGQVAIFSVAKFTDVPLDPQMSSSAGPEATTSPTTNASNLVSAQERHLLLVYLTSTTLHLGMLLAFVLPVLLMLTAGVMLVGRLVGLGPTMHALVLSLVVLLLLFPWQTLLSINPATGRDFVLPGVMYTWRDVVNSARHTPDGLNEQILYWARFYVWPLITVVLLLRIQLKSGRGLRMALGEARRSEPAMTDADGSIR